jgi:hypothetical protein
MKWEFFKESTRRITEEYAIMGSYKGKPAEQIDTAVDIEDANYLVGEYKMAFGRGWEIWYESNSRKFK